MATALAQSPDYRLHSASIGVGRTDEVTALESGSTQLTTRKYPPEGGNFGKTWQFPLRPTPPSAGLLATIRVNPFQWAVANDDGSGAHGFDEIVANGKTQLTADGFLNPAVDPPLFLTLNWAKTREGRYLLAVPAETKSSISLVELEAGANGRPAITSWGLAKNATLPSFADTSSQLGPGFNLPTGQTQGKIVVGGASETYVFVYDASRTSDRITSHDAPVRIANPAGFRYVSAGPGFAAGEFWVAGINGNGGARKAQLWYLKTADGAYPSGGPAAELAVNAGDWVVPGFVPYHPEQAVFVAQRSGSTPIWVLSGLQATSHLGTVAATSANAGFSVTAAGSPSPFVLTPYSGGTRAYLLARKDGEASWDLRRFDLDGAGAGSIGSSIVQSFGTAGHGTLVLESPDTPPGDTSPVSVRADSTGALDGGADATFTLTRTSFTPARTVTFTIDGTGATAGTDWTSPSPMEVTFEDGKNSAKLTVKTLVIDGCKAGRSFTVTIPGGAAGADQATQQLATATACTLTLTAPGAVNPGGSLTFTLARTGNTSGALAVDLSAVPGAGTTAADYVVPSGATIAAGSSSASVVVTTTGAGVPCRTARSFALTARFPQSNPPNLGTVVSNAATGLVNGNIGPTCASLVLTEPKEPSLPGDQVTVAVSADAATFDLAQTSWTVTPGSSTYAIEQPAGGGRGSTLVLRHLATSSQSLTVTASVPLKAGGTPTVLGPITIRPAADYQNLVRFDGPGQVQGGSDLRQQRRYRLLWQGSGDRASDWASANGRSIAWSYLIDTVTEIAVSCDTAADPSPSVCVAALPALAAGSGRTVVARVRIPNTTGAGPIVQTVTARGVAGPDTAKTGTAVRYVPVALEASGANGAVYETELVLVNRGGTTAIAELSYQGVTQTEVVGAGRQLVVNGLVERMRETRSTVGGGAAPVKVTFRNVDPDSLLVDVVARTTTPGVVDRKTIARGRSGLAYRGVKAEELFGNPSGSPARISRAVLPGLRGRASSQDPLQARDRTNVAFVAPEEASQVRVTAYRTNGVLDGTTTRDIPAGAVSQISYNDPFLANAAWVTAEWISGGPFTAYATPINNGSGDGSWAFAESGATGDPEEALVLPVVLEASTYRSDLTVASTAATLDLTLSHYWAAGKTATLGITGLNGQRILGYSADPSQPALGVVSEIRTLGAGNKPAQGETALGPAVLTRSGGVPTGIVFAGVRVDGVAPNYTEAVAGRYGVYLPAQRQSEMRKTTELYVLGLRKDRWVRSNLALYNVGGNAVDLQVSIYDGEKGSPVALSAPLQGNTCSIGTTGMVQLGAKSFCQLDNPLQTLGLATAWAKIARILTSNTEPFGAYGVVNDGANNSSATNDGAYLPPVRMAQLPCTFISIPPRMDVGAAASTQSVPVTAQGPCAWTAAKPPTVNWISLTNASGTGSGTFSLSVTENTSSAARSGTITVTSGIFTAFVTVVQSGREATQVTVTLPGGVPLVMVRIPAGAFQMGSPTTEPPGYSWEWPVHSVTLTSDYYLGKYEVTQAQWQAVMGTNPSSYASCGGTCPVEQVSWEDVAGSGGFITKLNEYLTSTGQPGAGRFRLPTEAEWERAARGGTQTRFSFGDALDSDDLCAASAEANPYVWWCSNSGSSTHAVGTKLPNPYGLYEMHGNVWEWCQDWFGDYEAAAPTNPTGPSTGSYRIARGGGVGDYLWWARSASRLSIMPGRSNWDLGFRLARSL